MEKLSKKKVLDYFILTARVLLAWTFLGYGFSKLTEGQFGLTEAEMTTQLKDISLFKLSWYLFDHEPFKSFTGISQIICGVLLLINKTSLIGAFLFLPIVTTILIIDLTFMPSSFATAFTWRLSFYIFLDFLILWHHKDKMQIIWNSIWDNMTTTFKYPVWWYLMLPVFAIALDIVGLIPEVLSSLIFQPTITMKSLMELPELISEIMKIGS